MNTIAELPECERPREKLFTRGAQCLSDQELIAIVLGAGIRGHGVMKVAASVLKVLDLGGNGPDMEALRKIEGVGPTKAALLTAALEFARRRNRPEGIKITFPTDVLPLIGHFSDRKQEHFLGISLNGAHEVISIRVVTVGLVDKTHVHPREVFADAITDRASSLIIAHNHPSGSLKPSREDMDVTRQLKAAGETLGLKLLDHIIFNRKGYYSFLEEGEL